MLTERALESFKQFVETNIAYAMVEYGGTMHKAKILTRERLKDGRVALSISITPEVSGTTTITKIQLYDTASKLWAEKSEAIKLKVHNRACCTDSVLILRRNRANGII